MSDYQRAPIDEDDVAVSLAVRRDLGAGHDGAVIAEFLDRVGSSIDERVEQRLNESVSAPSTSPTVRAPTVLGYVSVAAGIPVTAISLGTTQGGLSGVVAMVVGWSGLAAINFAHRARR